MEIFSHKVVLSLKSLGDGAGRAGTAVKYLLHYGSKI
jgi:hypothetical protein